MPGGCLAENCNFLLLPAIPILKDASIRALKTTNEKLAEALTYSINQKNIWRHPYLLCCFKNKSRRTLRQ